MIEEMTGKDATSEISARHTENKRVIAQNPRFVTASRANQSVRECVMPNQRIRKYQRRLDKCMNRFIRE